MSTDNLAHAHDHDNALMKSRRNKKACDGCNARSVRCRPSVDDISRCQNCQDYDETCTYLRVTRKRGAKPKTSLGTLTRTIRNGDAQVRYVTSSATSAKDDADNVTAEEIPWQPPRRYSQAQVVDLAEIYLEVVFPIFPFFHRPTLRRRIARGEHLENRPFYAAISALCALSAARGRDGATYSTKENTSIASSTTSETFFSLAEAAIPHDAITTKDLDYMRAAALLAITSIQYGKPESAAQYIAIYKGFMTVAGLHNESQWPASLTFVETEERRRLFWSMYTLDIFASVAWAGLAGSREALFNVEYPSEIDDDQYNSYGPIEEDQLSDSSQPCWIQGWNFVTDLYCILEHSIDQLRSRQSSRARSWLLQSFDMRPSPRSQTDVLQQIDSMYGSLPAVFYSTMPITCNLSKDIFSFQAANIAATVQLVRMVYLTNDPSTLQQKCSVASEVIRSFSAVPVIYLRAISSPLLYHLAGIGSIFSAAFHAGMTESEYHQIRAVLAELANLLESLETGLFCTPGTSGRLRSQISRIDNYMDEVRGRLELRGPVVSSEGEDQRSQTTPNYQLINVDLESPQYHFPPEILEDWSWGFDMA